MFKQIEGIIIDLDGTVYKGNQAIEGAAETIAYLKSQNKQLLFLSNRGNISRKMCHSKLSEMGLHISEEEILLSSTVTAQFLHDHYPSCKVWVLGEQGLVDEMQIAGMEMADTPEKADWLVVSLHETLTYKELNQAFHAVRNGARIMATNADKTFPGDEGDAIDVAGMIGAIVSATNRNVDLVIGKPSCFMAEAALKVMGITADKCLMIGDSLETDMVMGKMCGMATVLVLTGSTQHNQIHTNKYMPDHVWDSLAFAMKVF